MKLFSKCIAKTPLKYLIKAIYHFEDKSLEKEAFGLKFKNPVGLAAGFDKDADLLEILPYLGFGFMEIGTVTPQPQVGNPKPRLFRLAKDKALINRMGFNNLGVNHLVDKLIKYRHIAQKENCLIGVNIGKNKDTPNEEAILDYIKCFEAAHDYTDYFVVNVSSPNTLGLRELQDKKPLLKLLKSLEEINEQKKYTKPILLKIAPDLNHSQLDDIIEVVKQSKIAGLIATNTTISREELKTKKDKLEAIGNGGVSGQVILERSNKVIEYIQQKSKGKIEMIGVGGIQSAMDAKSKIKAGAKLVQVYTGLIYEGPGLVKRIKKGLLNF